MLLFKHTDNFSLCHAAPVNQSNQLNCSQMLQIKYKLYLTAWWAIKGAANRTRSRKEEQRLTYWISEAPAPCCLLLWHWDNWHQNRLKALRSSLPHSLARSPFVCLLWSMTSAMIAQSSFFSLFHFASLTALRLLHSSPYSPSTPFISLYSSLSHLSPALVAMLTSCV